MTEHPRLRNIGVLLVLALIYIIPALFVDSRHMLDIVSGPMLIFGLYALWIIAGEAWGAFWDGRSDRTAYALFGLSLLLFSVDIMRAYGLGTRNFTGLEWLENTHLYPVAIYCQFCGIWLFTRASTPPSIEPRRGGLGQLVAGVIIGAVVASSKMLEPVMMFVGKLFTGLVK